MNKDKKLQPIDVAMRYVETHPHTIYWRQDVYEFDGKRYRKLEDLSLVLHRKLINEGIGVSNQFISTAKSQIQAMTLIESALELPRWKTGQDRGEVIPFRNGLYEVKTGELTEHTPDYLCTFCLPFDFDPKSECPQWLKFLRQIFSDDEERIRLLQEWFGYCLMDSCRFEKYLLKIGPTRSGKGTVDKILRELIGDACVGYSLGELGSQSGLSILVGKRVALIGEAHLEGRRDRVSIMEKLKSIVGGDVQVIDRKYKERLSQSLPVKFTISANQVPSLYDCSVALTTRMLLLQFDHSFAGKEDTSLFSRLQTELPGIANWAIEGRKLLESNGKFTKPKSMIDEVAEIERNSSPILAFLQDCCVVSKRACSSDAMMMQLVDDYVSCPKHDLERAWNMWAHENSIPKSWNHAMKDLKALVPGIKETRPRVGVNGESKRVKFLHGIACI